jgi:hypothetical protein
MGDVVNFEDADLDNKLKTYSEMKAVRDSMDKAMFESVPSIDEEIITINEDTEDSSLIIEEDDDD